jgi:3-hydroxyisobutyrate dehydrogenase-like beta-hydroxyacid dehydrogenase
MGCSVAASARASGCEVRWASRGRSGETRDRAEKAGLIDGGDLEAMCRDCAIILSVCPPHAAEEVVAEVAQCGFDGIYVDANAISPACARRIEALGMTTGMSVVDGGIVGGPAWEAMKTWMYVSGTRAREVAACFSNGPLEVEVIGESVGEASGLKMCTAARVKGTAALFASVLALSESLGVRETLVRQLARRNPEVDQEIAKMIEFTAFRAWRFIGEMDEIAATYETAGLPGDFHKGARSIYQRLAGFKGAPEAPTQEALAAALLKTD